MPVLGCPAEPLPGRVGDRGGARGGTPIWGPRQAGTKARACRTKAARTKTPRARASQASPPGTLPRLLPSRRILSTGPASLRIFLQILLPLQESLHRSCFLSKYIFHRSSSEFFPESVSLPSTDPTSSHQRIYPPCTDHAASQRSLSTAPPFLQHSFHRFCFPEPSSYRSRFS